MYTFECKCGTTFQTNDYRRKKCNPECGRDRSDRNRAGEKRERERELHEVEFIGVDGEGINTIEWVPDWDDETGEEITVQARRHHYVLLSVGDQSLHKGGEPLTHDEIFDFLWEQFLLHPKAAFVGFFLGYDFTNWLKSIPVHSATSLLTKEGIARRQPKKDSKLPFPFPVRDGRWERINGAAILRNCKWEFDILGTKRFKLRPYVAPDKVPTRIVTHKDGSQEVVKEPRPWMYICDTGAFFQTSFLNAINPKKWDTPIVSPEEYALIEEGKANRQDAGFDEKMITYNLLENEVLARLMSKLNEGFVEDGIRLRKDKWFGPGQAAQEWMRLIGVPTGEEVREVVPQWARDAARKTYYGGWFEIFFHGPVPGTSYGYDINSAYPTVIAELPCLLHGRWSRGSGKPGRLPRRALRMVYGTFRGKDRRCGPLPYRSDDGSILRPLTVKGWYWWHEVKASQRAGVLSSMDIEEWIEYEPCECDPPMAPIRSLYEGRLLAGKNSPGGIAKKLVYNSSYGKLAQSIGLPRFSNPIWASLITAGCRTMILDAIATHPTKTKSLLMIATDGIYFKEPHPTLDIDGQRLGAWDAGEHENLSLFMPGLYWDDEARETIREGKAPKLKSRGVSARDLAKVVAKVDQGWRSLSADSGPPRIALEVDWAMTSAKQAIVRNQWWTCGEIVYGATRWLDGKPDAKRDPRLGFDRQYGALRSLAYGVGLDRTGGVQLETTYYDRGFGEGMNEDEVGELLTPDGTVGSLQAWAFKR